VFDNTQGQEINTNALKSDSSLKAYYRFESGALTTDSSGTSNTLTAISDPAETTGKFGGGVELDNNDAYSIEDDASLKPTGNFTVGAWIKHSTSTGQHNIFASYSENTNVAGFNIGMNANAQGQKKASFIIGNNTGTTPNTNYKTLAGNIIIDDNLWHFVVATWNGTTMSLYVDGLLDASVAWSTAPAYAATNYVRVGCVTISGVLTSNFWNGDLDDIFLLNGKALSAEEIRSLYAGGQDLRFSTDVLGKTRLAHEVVSWDTAGKTGEVWVKANTLGATTNTPIYVHYKNPTASALDENEAFGKHQVYVSGWKGIYHLNDNIDSTLNSTDLTASGSPTYVSGKINQAVDFGSSNTTAKLETTSVMGIDGGNITILGWYKLNAEIASGDWNFIKHGNNTSDVGYNFVYQYNSGTRRFVFARNKYFVAANTFTYDTTLGTSNYNHIVLRYNGTNLEGFLNSSNIGSVASSGNGGGNDYQGFVIGSGGTGAYSSIDADNVMVYSGALSDDFITTLYNNQNNPATFAIPQSTAGGAFLLQFV
jgi:hypothetical protein